MLKKRDVVVAIILTIVTCGIYGLVWFVNLTDEINSVSNNPSDTSGGVSLLLTLVTCGIYGWIWYFKMGEKLDEASQMRGLPTQSRGILYLVLGLFGLGIVSYALMQDSLNKMI